MKRMLLLIVTLLAFHGAGAAEFCVYEANYPDVKDHNVNLEQAVLHVHPRGAFVEMQLELVVSYDFQSWFFKNYNELEFLWDFQLPDQASVIEFWLEVGDTLLPAQMLDRWTAELLFSEVSSPVRNPALLTQSFPDREGMVSYNLRVYPLMRDLPRYFRLHYLLPARPTNESLRAWLPTSQLTSRLGPGAEVLEVVFHGETEPELLGAEIASSTADTCWHYELAIDYDQFVELVYSTPIGEKPFFSTFENEGDSFYQLALYPPEVEPKNRPRNFLILVDYNRFNTSDLDGELILLMLKETLQQALGEEDSCSISVAYDEIVDGSDRLVACTEENLDNLFDNVLRRSFPGYSHFQLLLAGAADFCRSRCHSPEVILLTNTDEIDLPESGREQYADEILAMFPIDTRIHIVDLDNTSSLRYNSEAGHYETQMASFYGRTCNKTGGNLFFLRYHSIKSILAALFYEGVSHFQEIEVQTRFASGYAFGKHLIALHRGYYPLHFPVMQVGRYRGTLPLELTVLGKVRMDKVTESITVRDQDVVAGDEMLARAWYGDFIHELLRKPQTNATILEIMNLGIKKRILTPYTGYLVFRPGENQGYDPEKIPFVDPGGKDEGGGDRGNEWDGGGPATDVADSDTLDEQRILELAAYPNPFNMAVNIEIGLDRSISGLELEFAIYNTLGQQVRSFRLQQKASESRIRLQWDGRSEEGAPVTSGLYFAILNGPDFKKTLKLLLVK